MSFVIGKRVRPWGNQDMRVGTVVEVGKDSNAGRLRVLWDGNPKARANSDRPKRTWVKASMLIEVTERDLTTGKVINDRSSPESGSPNSGTD